MTAAGGDGERFHRVVLATPWVHSDVLALIARNGLGVAPRDVEPG